MRNNREFKKIKNIKLLHLSEKEEEGVKIQQASLLIEFEGEFPKLIQGTQILKGDINGKHTIEYIIFDGKNIRKALYSIENLGKKDGKTKLKIIGISDGVACGGSGEPIDKIIEVSDKTFSIRDTSIQCEICQAIIKLICELLAEGIPEEDICAEVCSEVCLWFVETLVGYLICVGICATVCELGLKEVEDYGCEVGAQFICKKIGYC